MSSEDDSQKEDYEGNNEEEEEAAGYNKNESYGEEGIPKVTLTKAIIADCISMPYRLGYGFSHAFVKLDCSDSRLSDISVLREYIHLRFVILSNNFITDICPISHIGHLIYLKADNNQIASADCLNSLRFLQFIDLSGNKLTSINNLSFPLLQHLKVSENVIKTFAPPDEKAIEFCQLPTLQTLEVRGNQLKSLAGLGALGNLKSLYAAENMIHSVNEIGTCTALVRLHLRDNRLRRLDGFSESMSSLEYINLRGNRISKFRTIKALQVLPALKVLTLVDNPITAAENYRLYVIGYLNRLQRLDKERVLESERSGAANLLSRYSIADEELSDEEISPEQQNPEEMMEENREDSRRLEGDEEMAEEEITAE